MTLSGHASDQRYETNSHVGQPDIPIPNLFDVDFAHLTAWQRRVVLASRGWNSEMVVTAARRQDGETRHHVTIHVEHWNWHGSLCVVRLHAGAFSEPGGQALHDVIERLSATVMNRAFKAWEDFPHTVPRQISRDGRTILEDDPLSREAFLLFPATKAGWMVVAPERAYPTEALPGWPGYTAMKSFIDDDSRDTTSAMRACEHLSDILDMEQGFSDSLRGVARNDRFPFERPWHYGCWSMLRIAGVRPARKSIELLDHSTRDITSFGAQQLVKSVLESARHYRHRYQQFGERPPGQVDYVPLSAAYTDDDDVEPASTPKASP